VPQRSFARVTKRAAVIGAPAGDGRVREDGEIGYWFPDPESLLTEPPETAHEMLFPAVARAG